jgi:hypothetical protein
MTITSLFKIFQCFAVKLEYVLVNHRQNCAHVRAGGKKLLILRKLWNLLPNLLICVEEQVQCFRKIGCYLGRVKFRVKNIVINNSIPVKDTSLGPGKR